RFKGLGEMSAEQLWMTTMNPETRTLVRLRYADKAQGQVVQEAVACDERAASNPDEAAEDVATEPEGRIEDAVFDLLMGPDVPPRREFIEANATYAHLDV